MSVPRFQQLPGADRPAWESLLSYLPPGHPRLRAASATVKLAVELNTPTRFISAPLQGTCRRQLRLNGTHYAPGRRFPGSLHFILKIATETATVCLARGREQVTEVREAPEAHGEWSGCTAVSCSPTRPGPETARAGGAHRPEEDADAKDEASSRTLRPLPARCVLAEEVPRHGLCQGRPDACIPAHGPPPDPQLRPGP